MIDRTDGCFCNVCSHHWTIAVTPRRRFATLEDLVRQTGLRRDEVTTLAEIGALNSFGLDRRSALWQVERVVRPAGELFEEDGEAFDRYLAELNGRGGVPSSAPAWRSRHDAARTAEDEARRLDDHDASDANPEAQTDDFRDATSPLTSMTPSERLVADYAGTGLTIGPHPMSFRRHELSMRGILRASELPRVRTGRRVRTAGMVITRQRPGTAKGFVFLTLEDETGVGNIIVRPDFYDQEKMTLVNAPFLIVEGIVQTEDGVTAVRAEKVWPLEGLSADAAVESHDFR
jgi:error-prone DNA polymerase